MNTLKLGFAFAMGVGLGAFYFGSLWLTVRQLSTLRRPALFLFGSLVARLLVVVVGFYFVMHGDWLRLVVCLAGFLLARTLFVRHLQPEPPTTQPRDTKERAL